jgi:hypothetical protein
MESQCSNLRVGIGRRLRLTTLIRARQAKFLSRWSKKPLLGSSSFLFSSSKGFVNPQEEEFAPY